MKIENNVKKRFNFTFLLLTSFCTIFLFLYLSLPSGKRWAEQLYPAYVILKQKQKILENEYNDLYFGLNSSAGFV